MRKGASIIFINSENKVLLFLRDHKKEIPFPNCWDILGGGVEDGESPQETIKREIFEEIEVELRDFSLFRVYDMGDRIENTFWQRADFDISGMTLHEGQLLRWFTQEEINGMSEHELAFGFKSILLDFFHRKP
jgi:8-oxo-dGTP diphosphatase